MTLHLSLLRLPRHADAWQAFDPYQAHQLAWKAFPGVERGTVRPFLFHLSERGAHHSLLVQSTRPPDWDFLRDRPAEIEAKPFDPLRWAEAERLAFFLRANPTVDREGFDDGKKRRVGVGTNPALAFARQGRPEDTPTTPAEIAAWREGELRSWLERRAEASGFAVDRCEMGPIVTRTIYRPREHGQRRARRGRRMTFHEVEFSGTLRVTDAGRFVSACADGIGRGRAYGFGLLMLRHVTEA